MIIVLSPAKTLDYSIPANEKYTVPQFLNQSSKLIKTLKTKEPKDIASLMGLSDKLATLNFDRYQNWKASKKESNTAKPALLVFKGDVYQGLNAEDFTKGDMNFAQKHLRILSGLYGSLKPLDVINPYRLEMGTKLKVSNTSNLYEFWGNNIRDGILKDSKVIINLASVEYFKALGDIENLITKQCEKC